MPGRLRVAIVGLGAVARAVHLPILSRRSDHFEVVAVCDASPDALEIAGSRFGVPPEGRWSDLDQMVAGCQADALLVSHSGSHARSVVAGLDAGLAVLSEKPLAYTLDEVDRVERAGGNGRVAVGYMKQHDPAVVQAARLVADRPRPRSVEVTVLHPSADSQLGQSELDPHRPQMPAAIVDGLRRDDSELVRRALGDAAEAYGQLYTGVLLGSIIHELAVLRSLGISLASIDWVDRWPTDAAPPSLAVLGRTDDGVRVSIRWHYLHDHPAYREEVRWHDAQGTLSLVFPAPYLLRAPTELEVTARDGAATTHTRFASHDEAFEHQLLAFEAMARHDGPAPTSLDDARSDVVTCQQVIARLATHEGIRVGGEAGRHQDGQGAAVTP